MIKKLLIAFVIVVWVVIGAFPPISLTLENEDVKLKHIHLIIIGAVSGPASALAWLMIKLPHWLENNDIILIHRANAEKSN